MLRSIIAVLFGATAIVVGQFIAVRLLDVGWIRSYVVFYVATTLVPTVVGVALSRSWRKILAIAVAATVATYGFYKLAVQTGRSTELGNDIDWVVVLALTIGSLITAASVRALVRGDRLANRAPAR